jgi:signal transduction histidine kinase
MFWHGGFPILVIAYAILKDPGGGPSRPPGLTSLAVLTSMGSVLVALIALTLLATAGQRALPAIMQGHHYTPAMIFVVSTVWALSLLALIVLWRRRPHSVLDLWLMVVMVAWLFDIALAAVLNAGRFDLGFYAGRIYGLLAATFVLMLLLIEHSTLYARLVETVRETRALQGALAKQNEHLEDQVQARTRQLVETEKLATMGTLLAGVAHELNNPLSVIVGHVALLVETAPTEAVRARGRKLEQGALRCVRIIKNFLAMARRHPPERRSVALNEVLREALEILAYELRVANIEVTLALADDLPTVWADGHQLQQVAVNLLTNALHAMRETSGPRRLTVDTRSDAARGGVRIIIADKGPGIPADVQARIFEPFFTTKPEGQGTGLGLPLCRGIIESHGGAIRVESVPGRGATFVIELP